MRWARQPIRQLGCLHRTCFSFSERQCGFRGRRGHFQFVTLAVICSLEPPFFICMNCCPPWACPPPQMWQRYLVTLVSAVGGGRGLLGGPQEDQPHWKDRLGLCLGVSGPWGQESTGVLGREGGQMGVPGAPPACRAMMMTACDLSAITKPWEVQSKVSGHAGPDLPALPGVTRGGGLR